MLGGHLSPSSSTPVGLGNVVVDTGANTWLPYLQAIAAGFTPGYQIGFAMNPAVPGGNLRVAVDEAIPYASWNLGSGLATTVVAGNTPSRGGSPGTIIGVCDVSGSLIIQPAFTVTIVVPPLNSLKQLAIGAAGTIAAVAFSRVWVDASGGTCTVSAPTLVAGVQWGVVDGKKGTSFTGAHYASITNAGGTIEDPGAPGVYTNNPVMVQAPSESVVWEGDPTGAFWKVVG
jgi:hypothetical protein